MDPQTQYNQALDYLYSFVDYSLKHSSELAKAEFNLGRMAALMASLGNPQDRYPTIHITGTKGKGSTAALCAAAMQAAGLRVGLYTSPHLLEFTERMQVNNTPIDPAEFASLVEEIKPHVAAIPLLTTFEITTALGFLYFARKKVDAAVIEVGLGGRLDATNVITPLVSVITTVSYDHTTVLGNTLALIAGEKAGIIKPGVPVVTGPQQPEAAAVIALRARELGCQLTVSNQQYQAQTLLQNLRGQSFALVQPNGSLLAEFSMPLLGRHQQENALTAICALQASGLPVSLANMVQGFARVQWPCRFEVAQTDPALVFDSAHNEDAFRRLAQTLAEVFRGKKVTLILGISEDKHLPEMIDQAQPLLGTLLLTRANHPRALPTPEVASRLAGRPFPIELTADPAAALARALEIARKDGSIVVSAGSMFVTAEVKQAWMKRDKHERQ